LPVVAFAIIGPSPVRTRIVALAVLSCFSCFALYQGMIALSRALYGPFPHMPLWAALSVPGVLLRLFALLTGHGIVALCAGPFASRVEPLDPIWWTLVIGWSVAATVVFIRSARPHRHVMLGGLALAASCYGALAGGRSPYFAGGIPFDREARYQYAATVGVAVVTAVVFAYSVGRVRRLATRQFVTSSVFGTAFVASVLLFAPPIAHHVSERSETEAVLAAIRAETAKVPRGTEVRIQNQRFASVGPIIATAGFTVFPGWAAVFAIFSPEDTVDGRRVRFATDDAVVRAGERGLRSATLLISGGPPPASDGPPPVPGGPPLDKPLVTTRPECDEIADLLSRAQAERHCPNDSQDYGDLICLQALAHGPPCKAALRALLGCMRGIPSTAWRCDEEEKLNLPERACVSEVAALNPCME
jgi:hypothetical protein